MKAQFTAGGMCKAALIVLLVCTQTCAHYKYVHMYVSSWAQELVM